MGKYIEREKAVEELEKIPAYFDSGDIQYGVEIAIDQVKKIPTADVVKVVRCKDCKWCKMCYPAKAIGEEAIDEYYCNMFKQYRLPDNYCSYGELKELG